MMAWEIFANLVDLVVQSKHHHPILNHDFFKSLHYLGRREKLRKSQNTCTTISRHGRKSRPVKILE